MELRYSTKINEENRSAENSRRYIAGSQRVWADRLKRVTERSRSSVRRIHSSKEGIGRTGVFEKRKLFIGKSVKGTV